MHLSDMSAADWQQLSSFLYAYLSQFTSLVLLNNMVIALSEQPD